MARKGHSPRPPAQVGFSRQTCSHAKLGFNSRRDAKSYNARHSGGGADKLSPYYHDECMTWHLGHLPRAVRQGKQGRNEFYGRA